ncbi:MAG: hypothetical protein F4Y60_13935 [Boseongicola sp. SB0664_bin_43]|uniref:Uncharacterized protein n=1 Tax=Boseongicola sp. SB0664_bin_43 TaxID=2604844 RepID=A0A6B0Y5A0_9RHOB|nr:hypothetical protein [Boseongicola sp. SB0664_bin_43]MYK30905.1 hypothetical protein [Boseongicola sp. SB0670_bin_30]
MDWLRLHGLDARLVQDVLAAFRAGALSSRPFPEQAPPDQVEDTVRLPAKNECFAEIVVPVLASGFGDDADVMEALRGIEFAELPADGPRIPHTVDPGRGDPPVVVMAWQGRVDDLACLVHECAHALQIRLSDHDVMPPLAREACAFLGELLLVEHARRHDPALFGALLQSWTAENATYLGADLVTLSDALSDPGTAYNYRQNYPVARLAAVQLFKRRTECGLRDLFASGRGAMRHLSVESMADRAGDVANHLPPMPEPDADRPRMDAYRRLGARALLDIDYWEGASEARIGDYYASQQRHGREPTAFLALDDDRKPIGYATWTVSTDNGSVTLTRQAAPFGNHLTLQRALERHLQATGTVEANHPCSARARQAAW